MLNTLPTSAARQPRGAVKVNGQLMKGWVDFEVDNNAFYSADTFRCRFAISALPAGFGADWFCAQSALWLELFAGFPANPSSYTAGELKRLIYGKVDDVTYCPGGAYIEVSGRDLTSAFVDARTYEQFVNQTASQIATTLAKRHGLNPVVTRTTTKAGTYYALENRRVPIERSEWELLTWLANEEGFSVFVSGQDLHFQPATDPASNPYVLQWTPPAGDNSAPQFNGIDITFSRNLTLAKDIIVIVRVIGQKTGKPFQVKAQATHNKNTVLAGAAQPIGQAQTYSYVQHGKTKEEAQQWANNHLAQLSAHEMKLSANMPADNLLDITQMIQVRGTGTAFDQTYYADSIVRRMSWDGGYTMTLNAKNHSPESEVLA